MNSMCRKNQKLQSLISVKLELKTLRMDGWMTCNFTSFLTVCQSYQDDERLIMKGCVHWLRRFCLGRDSNSGPLDQQASP